MIVKPTRRGQSLLEVFLTVILVATIIFAVVGLYPGAMASLTRSHELTEGSNLCMRYIEQDRVTPFTSVPSLAGLPSITFDDDLYSDDINSATTPEFGGDANLTELTSWWTWNNNVSDARLDYVLFNQMDPP